MDVFVGLVTHDQSRYRETVAYAELLRILRQLGEGLEPDVFHEDLYSRHEIPRLWILARPFLIGLTLFRVRRYRRTELRRSIYESSREIVSEFRRGFGKKAHDWLVRNRNITQAHRELWAQALRSGRQWAAVFEDDVVAQSGAFPEQISHIMMVLDQSRQTGDEISVFLSGSFSFSTHGLPGDLSRLAIHQGIDLYSHESIRWSDTCAATLYSRNLLERICAFFDRLSPLALSTIPVDWLLDEFFLATRDVKTINAFHARPGLCTQSSLEPENPSSRVKT